MILENSGVGALIDLEAIPLPEHIPLDLWLTCFPSFGYILSVPERYAEEVRNRFLARDLACEAVGTVNLEGALGFPAGLRATALLEVLRGGREACRRVGVFASLKPNSEIWKSSSSSSSSSSSVHLDSVTAKRRSSCN